VSEPSLWSDKGWRTVKRKVRRSRRCGDAIYAGLADGMLVGTCARCGKYVCRQRGKKVEVPQ